MTEPIQEKVKRSLDAAEGLYYRLVLLAGEAGSGKTATIRNVAADLGVPVINLNLELAKQMLELSPKQRSLRLPEILEGVVDRHQPAVVLDNLEVLFDKNLNQDPLRLLQRISRNRTVLASWNGRVERGKLLYAEVGHPEYRKYEINDMLIVGMDGTVTADLVQNP